MCEQPLDFNRRLERTQICLKNHFFIVMIGIIIVEENHQLRPIPVLPVIPVAYLVKKADLWFPQQVARAS